MTRVPGFWGLCLVLTALAGCGERPQVIEYKQGTYQGKVDSEPYQQAPWNGDKAAWERAMTQRNQAQNEYKRTN